MSRKTIWRDDFVVEVYNLARSGMSESKMARALGISLPTFMSWENKKKIFEEAIKRGRKEYRNRNNKTLSFQNYVYKRLSPSLREIWKRINKLDKVRGGESRIEALLSRKGKLDKPVFRSSGELTEIFYNSLEKLDMKRWLQTLDSTSTSIISGFERNTLKELSKKAVSDNIPIDNFIESVNPHEGIRLILSDINVNPDTLLFLQN